MIILISGASHTGKTLLAKKLIDQYRFPAFSIDHLKMGLIRSKNTALTPLSDDEALTAYLWPIVCEMIRTAMENGQDLIVEGCYIPVDWQKDFSEEERRQIRSYLLIMSENYIRTRFEDIKKYASVVENRLDDSDYTQENALEENRQLLARARACGAEYILIDREYGIPLEESV